MLPAFPVPVLLAVMLELLRLSCWLLRVMSPASPVPAVLAVTLELFRFKVSDVRVMLLGSVATPFSWISVEIVLLSS